MTGLPVEMTAIGCPCDRVSSAMYRSRSWPMLCTVPEEETGCGSCGVTVATVEAAAAVAVGQRPDDRPRQQRIVAPTTNVGRLLRRHYYPEAGWGWVVVACACMVHLLNHGLQLSFGALEGYAVHRFRDASYDKTGQLPEDVISGVFTAWKYHSPPQAFF